MSLTYTTRPLSDRTWCRPADARRPSPFEATWTTTLRLLDREIGFLDGRDVVIEVDVPERAIRVDGGLRADARATSPAVRVAFTTRHGDLVYPCDRFVSRWSSQGPDWQQNVRAVALALESLRRVDRYGVADTGQQYTGFKVLGAGTATPASHMTRAAAIAVLADHAGIPVEHFNTDPPALRHSWRRARAAAHPDRHDGDQSLWDRVEEAGRLLGVDSR